MYWYLLVTIVLFSLFFMYKKRSASVNLSFNSKHFIINMQGIVFAAVVLWMYLLLALKSIDVGVDTATYKYMYSEAKNYFVYGINWDLLSQPLYYLSFGIPELMGVPFKTTQAVIYLFCVLALYRFINAYSDNKLLPCFFFVAGELLWFYMSGLRQTISISIGLLAIQAAISRKPFVSIGFTIIAIMFHKSAVILFVVLIFQYWLPTVKQLFICWAAGCFLVLVVPQSFLEWGANLLGFSVYSEFFGMSTNPFLILTYFSVGAFIFFVAFSEKNITRERLSLLAMATVGVLLIILSSRFYLLSRLFYYFQIVIYVVLSNSICKLKAKHNFILGLIVIACFMFYFAFATQANTLQTVPYEFFWEAGEKWL